MKVDSLTPDIHKLYSSLPLSGLSKVRAEIDTDALAYNYGVLAAIVKKENPACRPVCVVKADAYGHSAEVCVARLLEEGCDMFAVSSLEEALAVRTICAIQKAARPVDILILGYTPACAAAELIRHNIIQACFSLEYAEELAAEIAARADADGSPLPPLRVHLKFDTGMNRIGFPAHNAAEIAESVAAVRKVAALRGIAVEGAFTHFARADEDSDEGRARTTEQAERFLAVTDAVRAAGVPLPMRHICNSAAAVCRPEYHLDGCRLGILLYGLDPSGDVRCGLRPVMKLKTQIAQIHTLRAGESVSYGGTFTAPRDMRIATLPIGYADGFIRAYTGASAVIEDPDGGNRRGTAHIIGRICMDQCMIDLDGCEGVRTGDTVTLIGEPGQLDDLARRAGTINYECVCNISARVPRISARK